MEATQSQSPNDGTANHITYSSEETNSKMLQIVHSILSKAKALGANSLDLSKRNLQDIPEELMELSNLEYLYLEGNQLTSLPDDFFNRLPRIKWLDLRHNNLNQLPCVFLGRHQNLRTLLLDENQLNTVPLELGLVSSLEEVHLSGNPLEFPPSEVIEQGTPYLLHFLLGLIAAKTANANDVKATVNGSQHQTLGSNEHSDDSDDLTGGTDPARRPKFSRPPGSTGELHELSKRKSSLTQHKTYTEARQHVVERLSRMSLSSQGVSGKRGVLEHRSPAAARAGGEGSAGTAEEASAAADRRRARLREHHEKQDAILQRRKDEELLKDWREESRKLQHKKHMDSFQAPRKDFTIKSEAVPFGVDEKYMKMMSNEERLKEPVETPERARLTPRTRKRLYDEGLSKDLELEVKIKEHTTKVMERRRAPKANPREEMETAKRELQMVKQLQGDLLDRYKQLKHWTAGPGNAT